MPERCIAENTPESMFDFDIKQIENKTFDQYLQEKEDGELSDAFWDVNLVHRLDTSVASSPFFNVFLAAQVKENDRGFLSKEISVNNLIIHRGDIHHIFPKNYLKKAGLTNLNTTKLLTMFICNKK